MRLRLKCHKELLSAEVPSGSEPYGPTIAAAVTAREERFGTASRLRTLLESEQSSPTSDSTPKRPAHLVALSGLTREGRGKFFHSVPSGSNSVMDATARLCRRCLCQNGNRLSISPATVIGGTESSGYTLNPEEAGVANGRKDSQRVLKIGSAGDSPARVGDPLTGTAGSNLGKRRRDSLAPLLPFRPASRRTAQKGKGVGS